jgi:ABC-type sugar transport system ATPase subunit
MPRLIEVLLFIACLSLTVSTASAETIAGRGVSMVFQSFALYPHLTAYENFAYPLVEEGVSRAERAGDRLTREAKKEKTVH